MTEKQGKKLLAECDNDFKTVADKLEMRFGKLIIDNFENLLKYGNPQNSSRAARINPIFESSMDMVNNTTTPLNNNNFASYH
jgi:hypothetical protein